MLRALTWWCIAVAAIVAIAAWPSYIARRGDAEAAASVPTPAPIVRDDLFRNEQVAFWERAAKKRMPNDFLSPRMLSGQYMQRYREAGDIGDVLRALSLARREERVVPHSVQADVTTVAPLVTLHRFRDALTYIDDALATAPAQTDLLTRKASAEMELGRYEEANADLERAERLPAPDDGIDRMTVRARFDEVTGHLTAARRLLQRAATLYDAYAVTASAQSRAWYHERLGELAFAAGDGDVAITEERRALDIFPRFAMADTALARFLLALHRPREALEVAERGAAITPLVETLGYEADAQRLLGDAAAAAQTRDLIVAVERIGNAYRVSDRLIAVYYAEHHLRAEDALRIARRDAANRGREVFAQDTLAWAAAMAGRWSEGRRAMRRAIRYDTEDARLQFHAGMIALHFHERAEAKRRLARALALNPQFHPWYADEARQALARL